MTKHRDTKVALRFFNKAIGCNGKPGLINIDKSGANKAGIKAFNEMETTRIKIRSCKYLNNIVEQGHRYIKRVAKSMVGFKNFWSAQATLKGIELMTMLKKGQQKYSSQSYATPAGKFYALAG